MRVAHCCPKRAPQYLYCFRVLYDYEAVMSPFELFVTLLSLLVPDMNRHWKRASMRVHMDDLCHSGSMAPSHYLVMESVAVFEF